MQIPNNELRIGNWVLINNQYIHMDLKMFHAVLMRFEGYVPEPIPLTPEILEKCGFEKKVFTETHDAGYYTKGYTDSRVYYFRELGTGNTSLAFCDGQYDKCSLIQLKTPVDDGVYKFLHFAYHPKYLHELQNLYFGLTGKELPINLK